MSRLRYAFRNFELDPAGRELRENGLAVELPASAFDCLVYLIEHRDRPISRDELISATWGCSDTSETTLAHTIVRLRRLFGDAGKEQHTIRTVPRVGYRWVASTCEQTAPELTAPETAPHVEAAPAVPVVALPTALRRLPSRRWLAAAALVVAATAAGALMPRPAVIATAPSTPAVLPTDIETLPSEWAWLRFAVTDLVATRLSHSRAPAMPGKASAGASARPAAAHTVPADIASLRVQPDVTRVGGHWRVALQARDANGRRYVVDGHGGDVMEAARRASDALLDTMGHSTAGGGTPAGFADGRLDVLLAQADAAAALERYDEAAGRLGEARALAGSGADGGARVDVASGTLLLRRQQPAMALPYLNRAIAHLDPTRHSPVLIDALTKVADAQLALRANDAALVASSQAWSLAAARDDTARNDSATLADTHARALAASGNPGAALRLLDDRRAGTPLGQARLQAVRAWLALRNDDADAALDAATQALIPDFARADRHAYARAWIDKILALQQLGRSRESRTELRHLTRWCADTCTSMHALRLSLLAGQAAAEQRRDDAITLYANALRAADRTGTPATQTTIAAAYLDLLVASGRLDVAVAVAGRLPERDLGGLPPRARAAAGAVRAWQEQFLQGPGLARVHERRRERRDDLGR